MKCPLCGGKLSVTRTDNKISNFLVRRDRSCDTPLCPYVNRTFEILEVCDNEILLDHLFDLVRRVATNGEAQRVKDKLFALHKEICGMK